MLYDLDITEKQLKDAVSKLFRKHDEISDPVVLDRLLFKGELDLQETMEQVSLQTEQDSYGLTDVCIVNQWKQRSHLQTLLFHQDEVKKLL